MGVRPGIMYTLQSCTFLHLRHVVPETGQTVSLAILPYVQCGVNYGMTIKSVETL